MDPRIPPPPPSPPRRECGTVGQDGRQFSHINMNQQQGPHRSMFGEASGMPAPRPNPSPVYVNPVRTNGRYGGDPLVTYTQWTLSKEKPKYPGQPSTWAVVKRREDPFDPAELKQVVSKKQAKGMTVDKAFSQPNMTENKKQQVRRLAQDLNQRDFVPGYDWVVKTIKLETERKSGLTTFVHVILKRQQCIDPTKPAPRRLLGFVWRDVVDLTPEGLRAEHAAYLRSAAALCEHGPVHPGQQQRDPTANATNAGLRPFPQPYQKQPGHEMGPGGRPFPQPHQQQPGHEMGRGGRSPPRNDFPPTNKAGHRDAPVDSDEDCSSSGGKKRNPTHSKRGKKPHPKIVQVSHSEGSDSASDSSASSDNDSDSFSGADTDTTPGSVFSNESREHRKGKKYHQMSPKGSPRLHMKASREESRASEYRQHQRPRREVSPARSVPRYNHERVEIRPNKTSGGVGRPDSLHGGGTHYPQSSNFGHSEGPRYDRNHQFGLPGRTSSMYEPSRIMDYERPMIDQRELDKMRVKREVDHIRTELELENREEKLREREASIREKETRLREKRIEDQEREMEAKRYQKRIHSPPRRRYYED
ncbi:MAG: hypothetical protein Q9217_004420 [Psora testacea]